MAALGELELLVIDVSGTPANQESATLATYRSALDHLSRWKPRNVKMVAHETNLLPQSLAFSSSISRMLVNTSRWLLVMRRRL
jgi:hypothetical protein